MATLKNGILIDPKVQKRLFTGIEKGPLANVNALVIHQTGAPTAQHTFNSYQNGSHGAHLLIDKMGKIYQTATKQKLAQKYSCKQQHRFFSQKDRNIPPA